MKQLIPLLRSSKLEEIEKKKVYDKGYRKGFYDGYKQGSRIGKYKGERHILKSAAIHHDTYKARTKKKKEILNYD